MDPLNSFKQEIQMMFQKSFRQLSQKNNLNKTILTNLVDAATEQSRKISQMDKSIENLKRLSNPQSTYAKNQLEKQQKLIHNNFDSMMHRLAQIEQNIISSTKNLQSAEKINREADDSLNQVIQQLEKIEKQENIPEYQGDQETLMKQIDEFEKALIECQSKNNNIQNLSQKCEGTILQPFQTFQTKLDQHHKKNQLILKEKLTLFNNKMQNLENKVEQVKANMSEQMNKSNVQYQKIAQQMGLMQQQMLKIRTDLQTSELRRKKSLKGSANLLDTMIEQMLIEAKNLEERVETLRNSYNDQNNNANNR